jgi:hypothetical protein
MVNNFTRANGAEVQAANRERWDTDDMEEPTVLSTQFVPVFEAQSDRTEVYAPGAGIQSTDRGEGFADLDLKLLDDSSSVVDAKGKLRWEMYRDSSREDLARVSTTFTASNLRSAVNADRTEKELLPQLAPAAPQDGYLVLAYRPTSSQDGYDVSASDSAVDLGIPYSRIK